MTSSAGVKDYYYYRNLYASRVLATEPIAYWQLNEGAGTTIEDSSGNSYNGTYTGVTWDGTKFVKGGPVPFFDGSNDVGDVYSAAFASAFSGVIGCLAGWVKVANSGVWTDGVQRYYTGYVVDASNSVAIRKRTTNDQFQFFYNAGGTAKQVIHTISTVDWFHIALNFADSANGDLFEAYVNGSLINSQSGTGTWSGDPVSNRMTLGAATTTPSEVHHGYLAHWAHWDRNLSASEIAKLAA